MANVLYDTGREGILDTTIPMTGDIRVMLVPSTYSFVASHRYISDMGVTDNGRTTSLQNKTYTSGVFDADNISLTATSSQACSALVLFYNTGDDTTARLIAFVDSPSLGLPVTPSVGQTVQILWDTGSNEIFKL
jgi:hypothetical protein